jgi:tRNA threonylcarbamoyladenosine biosynthesis protein TsaB
MKLLALDTSTEACSVALLLDGVTHARYELAPGAHSRLVLPMIESLFAETGLRLRDLDALAFGRGPGSFTGVRIAAGVVQGLAFGADLPVVPVSTLAAVAQGALALHRADHVLAALDARMHEVYWGAYEVGADGVMRAVQNEAVVAPGQVMVPARDHWYGAGPGWGPYRDALTARVGARLAGCDATLFPRAAFMLPIAAAEFVRGAVVPAELALPVYLRDQVAHRPGG